MKAFLTNLFSPTDNILETTSVFLTLLGVKFAKEALKKELEEHPDYPSLLCLSDQLTKLNIDTIALKIKPENFINLSTPFICQLKLKETNQDQFTVIKTSVDNTFQLLDPTTNTWTIRSFQELSSQLTGVVLLAEANENSADREYTIHKKEETRSQLTKGVTFLLVPIITMVACALVLIRLGPGSIAPILLTIITLLGALITNILIWYEVDEYNPVLQQLCSSSKKVNCSAILQSKGAKILGVSWSSIGFVYFTGTLLLLLFTGIVNPSALSVVSILICIALPYVGYSIYYQWKVMKQWCILCLGVQGVILLQFIVFLFSNWELIRLNDPLAYAIFLPTLLAYVLPTISVLLLIPALKNAKAGKYHALELKRLKHNPRVFESLLTKDSPVIEPGSELGIILGNSGAKNKLIKVCNPYCQPCANAHPEIESILKDNQNVQVQIIFTALNNNADSRVKPVRHFLAIAENEDKDLLKRALDDWYLAKEKNYENFASKYPMNGALAKQSDKIEAMNKWCETAGISFTPTFIVNGYKLPVMYSPADLKYLLHEFD